MVDISHWFWAPSKSADPEAALALEEYVDRVGGFSESWRPLLQPNAVLGVKPRKKKQWKHVWRSTARCLQQCVSWYVAKYIYIYYEKHRYIPTIYVRTIYSKWILTGCLIDVPHRAWGQEVDTDLPGLWGDNGAVVLCLLNPPSISQYI